MEKQIAEFQDLSAVTVVPKAQRPERCGECLGVLSHPVWCSQHKRGHSFAVTIYDPETGERRSEMKTAG